MYTSLKHALVEDTMKQCLVREKLKYISRKETVVEEEIPERGI